jgi:hypothetical protein
MLLTLFTLALTISAQVVPGNPPTPPLRYILDQPQVKDDLLEINRGCLARRNTTICDCFMRNFKLKTNGRDVTEGDLKMAIDISYRRNEKALKKQEFYFSLKELMVNIERSCTEDSKWEMDVGDDVPVSPPEVAPPLGDKAPASTKSPKK